ncbi:molybdopterin molybdotransferase MoeA [Helicobacter pametensis]|uniref:molybdopterin molybdotransferase MoeA n=1 Tax=Helicobacter pametensis TaxID=95149 RepID=UPI0004B7AE14|nr:molybdopterin molybdotransferase MoeA [Helicobacter pametensis]
MISLRAALDLLFAQSLPLSSQYTPLFESYGKILSQPILASRNLPAFSNSAMDGYAIASIESEYELGGSVLAGEIGIDFIPPHQCIKIMTGAKIPSNAIAVIPFEHATILDHKVIPTHPIKQNQNIKLCGEDYAQGSALLRQGERLDYAALALLASQGIHTIPTYKKHKIAIFASGDELKEPWESAQEHQIYNTNAIAYHALLQEAGFESQYLGILPDDKEILQNRLSSLDEYDVLITSGGASVGEADFFEEILKAKKAEILFHGINIKPGRPMLCARLNHTLIFSLPGNPLSGALNLITLVLPTLQKLSGSSQYFLSTVRAKHQGMLKLKKGRAHMILGIFDGYSFSPFMEGKYGSGSLKPLQACNAIAIFDEEISSVQDGREIDIIPLPCRFSNRVSKIINLDIIQH